MAPITVTTELLDTLSATCESHKQRADNLEAEVTALRAANVPSVRERALRVRAEAAESERDALRVKNQRLEAALRKMKNELRADARNAEDQDMWYNAGRFKEHAVELEDLLADPPSETVGHKETQE